MSQRPNGDIWITRPIGVRPTQYVRANETWAQWRWHCSQESFEALEDMAEAGAAATMETWPTARRVEVARDVLAAAGVPDLLDEAERLREIVHRQTHVVPDPACPRCRLTDTPEEDR